MTDQIEIDGLELLSPHVGERIERLEVITPRIEHVYGDLDGDAFLILVFESGAAFKVKDDSYDCCESRYISSDDNGADWTGARYVGMAVKEVRQDQTGYDQHEMAFLSIETDRGPYTLCTHNEHNGYYDGLYPSVSVYDD